MSFRAELRAFAIAALLAGWVVRADGASQQDFIGGWVVILLGLCLAIYSFFAKKQ